jgi:hypothetical protein
MRWKRDEPEPDAEGLVFLSNAQYRAQLLAQRNGPRGWFRWWSYRVRHWWMIKRPPRVGDP